ncbi:hypothetical protein CVT24_000836 [Panaeolus cyanescens]|uniref:Uncharacterized protein n=1 Tax=Panaeolus cyanescens TaxID=181874 RepID=A0A409VWX3_9AGAR|nr:hypothetical protein CVT24_000836 [Panaeolus cyanescens]
MDTWAPQDRPELYQKPNDYAINVLVTAARHSQRWHDLELRMPTCLFDEFQNLVSVNQLPMLANFRAIFEDRPGDRKADIKWLLSPSVRRVSLQADLDSFANSVNWASLTYLCLHSAISSGMASEILVQCQQLEFCSISLLRFWTRHRPEDDIDIDNIYLPRLKYLMIDGDGVYQRMYLCNRIIAPELRDIFYYSHQPAFTRRPSFYSDGSSRSTSPEPQRNFQSPLSPLQTLLNRSKAVKQLSFNPRGVSDADIYQLLQAASSVETLFLDYHGWKTPPPSAPGDSFNLKLFLPPSLRTVPVDNVEGGSFDPSETLSQISPNDPILLPHLISLKAWGVHAMTDQTLLDFITSRMEGECTKHGCVPLKRVLMTFKRTRQMDIVPHVRKIEPDGEQLQLNLVYTPEPPPFAKETSGRFGLNVTPFGPDTTWPYPENYNVL